MHKEIVVWHKHATVYQEPLLGREKHNVSRMTVFIICILTLAVHTGEVEARDLVVGSLVLHVGFKLFSFCASVSVRPGFLFLPPT